MKYSKSHSIIIVALVALCSFYAPPVRKPALWLIGDSTVEGGSGSKGLWGWGKFLPDYLDTGKIRVLNYAQGGASARTYFTGDLWDKRINKRGMWDTVSMKLQAGDWLLMQFGLNDQSPVDDSARSRGTLPGTGQDSVVIFNRVTGKPETVHSFGWYLRSFIRHAHARGARVIVCSSIPRNRWQNGKLLRGENGFAQWALQVAREEKAYAIDLNSLMADRYDAMGEKEVTEKLHISGDNTHTTEAGARLNAETVAQAMGKLKGTKLKHYVRSKQE